MSDLAVPSYSIAERDRRWDLARAFMENEGLDALLVFGEHEDAGPAQVAYDTWFTNGRPGTTVIFPRTGEPLSLLPGPMFIADHLESSHRGGAMWIPPKNLRGSRHSAAIAATLDELGLAKATIGVVGLGAHLPWHPEGIMPFHLWNKVLARFPEAKFTPVDTALARLVSRLSPEEIDVVRHSAGIGDAMVHAMVETAAPGVPESEVYAAGMAEGYRRGTLPAAMHFWSGPDPVASSLPEWGYRPTAPRVLREGDVIYAEVFANFGGRHTQHQVTIAIGEVHEDFHRAGDVARAAYDAGLEALRPGRTFGELVDAMHKPILAADGSVFSIAVHSLNPGLALGGLRTDIGGLPGAEDYPPVPDGHAFFADMELDPGMTFVLEPNYAFGRHMVHIGGTMIVGEDLPIELNPYTAQILRATGPAPRTRR
ncbi:M24 family peptidase [Nonomuraea diastatica]|uniref:Aminopeptidase P family protein n=1 Tax=Nonomuraea diastatica TaxID=1848329 RepID=A0A4V2YG42_9ACTN|nr:M24 family peptidase [Nonomuraea diastatica]TDD25557.1 aminopeptidase P family protein [Nonomuraea diastatica]